jgi:hypothetical protein
VKISLGQLLSGALVALLPLLAAADQVVPVDEVTSYVKIREAPDASAEIVGRLHRSKPRRHVATVAGWHEVVLDDGSSGFVSSDWSVIVLRSPSSLSPVLVKRASHPGLPVLRDHRARRVHRDRRARRVRPGRQDWPG